MKNHNSLLAKGERLGPDTIRSSWKRLTDWLAPRLLGRVNPQLVGLLKRDLPPPPPSSRLRGRCSTPTHESSSSSLSAIHNVAGVYRADAEQLGGRRVRSTTTNGSKERKKKEEMRREEAIKGPANVCTCVPRSLFPSRADATQLSMKKRNPFSLLKGNVCAHASLSLSAIDYKHGKDEIEYV